MNWDYIAGFFDGEGCLAAGSVSSATGMVRYSFSISQKDIEPLLVIKDFLREQGVVSHISDVKSNKQHILHASNRTDVLKIVLNLKDRCIVKKQKLKDALPILLDPKGVSVALNKDERDKVLSLWLSGLGIVKICKETGISKGRIGYFIDKQLGGARMRSIFAELNLG